VFYIQYITVFLKLQVITQEDCLLWMFPKRKGKGATVRTMDALSQIQTFPSQITNCSFCLKKDLYAVLFVTGQVTCYRLNGSIVCTPLRSKAGAQHGPVTSLSWRPDGRFLAIGFESGNVRLFETETGQCVATLNERFTTPIGCLLWTCDLTQNTSINGSQEMLRGVSNLPNLKGAHSHAYRL
jgi:anaphase-promoting complex subunit 4